MSVTMMDIDQTMTLHRKQLALMQEYTQALGQQKQVDARTKWVGAMQHDLLRMAPGDPEAAAIVAELNLAPGKSSR